MKKIILTGLIFAICGAAQAEITRQTYFNDSIPASNTIHIDRVGDTYYSSSGTTYRKQDDYIYGSNGSAYTYGASRDTVQEMSTGRMYQRSGNLWQQVN